MANSTTETGNLSKRPKVGKIGYKSYGKAYSLPFDVWMTLFEEIEKTSNVTHVAKVHKIKRQSLSRKYNNYINKNVDPSKDTRGYCKRIFSVQEELNIFDELWSSAFTIGFEKAFSNQSIFYVAKRVHKMKSEDENRKPFVCSIGWANGFRKRHGIDITNGKANYYNWEVLF